MGPTFQPVVFGSPAAFDRLESRSHRLFQRPAGAAGRQSVGASQCVPVHPSVFRTPAPAAGELLNARLSYRIVRAAPIAPSPSGAQMDVEERCSTRLVPVRAPATGKGSKEMVEFDVVIVGAGPAGATAAIILA